METFSLLTYNLLFNKAYQKLDSILNKWHPDILCFQEIDTSEENLNKITRFKYKLADFSNSFIQFDRIFGVATFYNPSTFSPSKTESVDLAKNMTERFLNLIRTLLRVNQPRTVLRTDFYHKSNKKRITVYNTHLAYVATNAVRIKHIRQILEFIDLKIKNPSIINGDFNYLPYARKKLENIMREYKFNEATNGLAYTHSFTKEGKYEHFNYNSIQKLIARIYSKFFSNTLKVDYIFYKNLQHISTKRIESRWSDHFPILTYFRF